MKDVMIGTERDDDAASGSKGGPLVRRRSKSLGVPHTGGLSALNSHSDVTSTQLHNSANMTYAKNFGTYIDVVYAPGSLAPSKVLLVSMFSVCFLFCFVCSCAFFLTLHWCL